MRDLRACSRTVCLKPTCLALCFVAAGVWMASSAAAHELWIETGPDARPGGRHRIEVSWGHSGERVGGPALAAMADKLTAFVKAPDGTVTPLKLAFQEDCYAAEATLAEPGFHAVGAVLETGIIERQLHDIPPRTRIVMVAQACVRAGGGEGGAANRPGLDIEFALSSDPGKLRPGDLVTARLLFQGKPLGGREALVSLGTAGPNPPAVDSAASASQWTVEAHPDPKTGEVRFPLIAAGRHILLIRYFDQTPGRYEGDLDFASEFSHLRKGDAYERTMHVATFAFDVSGE